MRGCVAIAAATLFVQGALWAQDDTSEPIPMPYQDEEAPGQGEPAPSAQEDDLAPSPAESADPASDDVDFFDTLEFLGEGDAARGGDTGTGLPEGGSQDGALPGQANSRLGRTTRYRDETPGWDIAVFRGLDKVTARVWMFEAFVRQPVSFGRFEVNVQRCNKRPPEEPPHTTAFVEIEEITLTDEHKKVFNGWMFASSPGLNGVEHPVYDVWLIDCKMAEAGAVTGIEENVDVSADSESEPVSGSITIAD